MRAQQIILRHHRGAVRNKRGENWQPVVMAAYRRIIARRSGISWWRSKAAALERNHRRSFVNIAAACPVAYASLAVAVSKSWRQRLILRRGMAAAARRAGSSGCAMSRVSSAVAKSYFLSAEAYLNKHAHSRRRAAATPEIWRRARNPVARSGV